MQQKFKKKKKENLCVFISSGKREAERREIA